MTQVFTTGSGQSIVAGAELGHGGEGTILEVQGDPSRCIKLRQDLTRRLDAANAAPPRPGSTP